MNIFKINFSNQQKNIPIKSKSTIKKISYAQITGLRSMQHISGVEREIIEAYKNELPHEVWGLPDKLKEWAINKYSELRSKNYKSTLLDNKTVQLERNDIVDSWANIIDNDINCANNPFLKLKIIRSIVKNLKENNAQFPPSINYKVFEKTVHEIKNTGGTFLKTYYNILRKFDTLNNTYTEEVCENGIKGKWYSVKIPNYAQAKRKPALFKNICSLVAALSQRTNWCTRNPKVIKNTFLNMNFHIFIDVKGIPQICMVSNSGNNLFKYISANNQYIPISYKYKQSAKSYLERHKFLDAKYGETEFSQVPIFEIFK